MTRLQISSITWICQMSVFFITNYFIANANTDFVESGIIETNEIPTFRPLVYDNGMLHLVLKDLAEDLISDLSTNPTINMSNDIERLIQNKVQGFYQYIKDHPSLKSKSIAFTKAPLQTETQIVETTTEPDSPRTQSMNKRSAGQMAEICQSTYAWESRTVGENMDHQHVRLYEGQQFHVMSCVTHGASCRLIPSRHNSQCRERNTWTPAQVWSETKQRYVWDHIAINTSCNCAVVGLSPSASLLRR